MYVDALACLLHLVRFGDHATYCTLATCISLSGVVICTVAIGQAAIDCYIATMLSVPSFQSLSTRLDDLIKAFAEERKLSPLSDEEWRKEIRQVYPYLSPSFISEVLKEAKKI